MSTHTDELKARVCQTIDAHRDRLLAIGQEIFENPELGYKEFRTAGLVTRQLSEWGIPHRSEIAVTGVIGHLAGRRRQGTVAILGELDSVLCAGHPQANPESGAAHACGHNAQIAAMLGAAIGLAASGVMSELDGDVELMAIPAEEPVEIEFRRRLMQEGRIRFLGGKQEFIARGELDHVDAAMLIHLATPGDDDRLVAVGGTGNGFVAKFIRYVGREAHAGGAPHMGINALNAATLGLMGIHAQRETFKDEDNIRVHPIITRGGDLVNIVPADVRLETYVRGRTMEAIADASAKVNRALEAGAMAVGATVEIDEIPGFLPLFNDPGLSEVFRANAAAIVGADRVADGGHGGGSTDMADVAHLLPAIHPSLVAARGRGHSEDYQVSDPDLAYLGAAKMMAMTVVDLLVDDAARLRQIKADFRPRYTKEEYLAMWDKLCPPLA
ncbi:MAG: amidohydrolase [Bacillota bacterium]